MRKQRPVHSLPASFLVWKVWVLSRPRPPHRITDNWKQPAELSTGIVPVLCHKISWSRFANLIVRWWYRKPSPASHLSGKITSLRPYRANVQPYILGFMRPKFIFVSPFRTTTSLWTVQSRTFWTETWLQSSNGLKWQNTNCVSLAVASQEAHFRREELAS